MFSRFVFVAALGAASLALAGCDQKPAGGDTNTAGNSAQTNASGGEGVPTGGTCGGPAGLECASDKDFCKRAEGQCGVMDASGTCTTKPEICTKERDPVCGCDGKTYDNACRADEAGVSVQAKGECPKGGGDAAANASSNAAANTTGQ